MSIASTPRMRRARLAMTVGCAALVWASGVSPMAANRRSPAAGGADNTGIEYRSVVNTYCVTCHSQRLKTAGLVLEGLDVTNVAGAGEVWERVLQKLRSRAMPPPGSRRPDEATYDSLSGWLERSLDQEASAHPAPGRPALYRLNRTEYHNAIHDLLALDVDVSAMLPADDSAYGFDNVADALGVSPVLLESYMTAARKISRLAVGRAVIPVTSETYRIPGDLSQDSHLDGLPLGTRGGLSVRHHFPVDGEYEIRVRLARNANEAVKNVDEEHQIEITLEGARVQLFAVGGKDFNRPLIANDQNPTQTLTKAFTADEHLRVRLPVKAGDQTIVAAFIARSSAYAETPGRGLPAIDRIVISGPYRPVEQAAAEGNTTTRQRIFVCQAQRVTDETRCAQTILTRLARLAYRRPLRPEDSEDLLRFFATGRRQGSFDAGIELALRRILASPQFVFRFEDDPPGSQPGAPYRLNDLNLASRLSFFLWSSIPDEELLKVAEQGRLSRPDVLRQQVQRMLADPRSASLVSNFGGQWLLIRNLRTTKPNPQEFPDFDDNLRQALRRETELFLESIIREDRPVPELLTADYTFLNERLARHYGIPNIYGDRFRRVTITDENRRGLLGHGSVLTATSYATRTSPVLRGKWVLETLLAAPPPAPPPNVPQLKEDTEAAALSMRERMAQHRTNPSCASCHARMDPIGLALENFDAVGRWRTKGDDGGALDTAGTLIDGTAFNGPAGLRAALLRRPELFVGAVAEKLLTYAIGRGLTASDGPAVRAIVREAAQNDSRFSSLVWGIVNSVPFRMKATADRGRPFERSGD
jgi:mono/diheme cytochrome c family protein